jgi:hypothetical protein
MTQVTFEDRYKQAVKKAHVLASEAIKEAGLGGNLQFTLEASMVPDLVKHFLADGAAQVPPVTPIPTMATMTVPSPKPQVPTQMQVFTEFLNRLPAQLRPLLRIRDHTGTEILIVSSEKLASADFAAVCRVAEELKGRWVSAGRDSAWHLPISTPQSIKK